MPSVNKVVLIGNLGRDPEVRYSQSGSAICNITVATSRQWKDRASGENLEETEWHRITLFDRLAEIAVEYLKKGRPVYIEGRLKTRRYIDKDGAEKYATDIIATEMQLLGGRDAGGVSSNPDHIPRGPVQPQVPVRGPKPTDRKANVDRGDLDGGEPPF
jgi:single-strand DNA-binding protein